MFVSIVNCIVLLYMKVSICFLFSVLSVECTLVSVCVIAVLGLFSPVNI